MSAALVLTYHAVERGAPPLCIDPGLFREHLSVLDDARAESLTVSELAAALGSGEPLERKVAITFDDGFASVPRSAGPALAEHGLTATVFCVGGHLGGENDWPSQHPRAPRLALAAREELAELAEQGFEIGSHGMEHHPLHSAPEDILRRELLDSKESLEEAVQRPITSFAYPYGLEPSRRGRELVEQSYSAGCTGRLSLVRPGEDPLALPRVDAHYLRDPELLHRTVHGSVGPYLRLRRLGARARRAIRKDYLAPTS